MFQQNFPHKSSVSRINFRHCRRHTLQAVKSRPLSTTTTFDELKEFVIQSSINRSKTMSSFVVRMVRLMSTAHQQSRLVGGKGDVGTSTLRISKEASSSISSLKKLSTVLCGGILLSCVLTDKDLMAAITYEQGTHATQVRIDRERLLFVGNATHSIHSPFPGSFIASHHPFCYLTAILFLSRHIIKSSSSKFRVALIPATDLNISRDDRRIKQSNSRVSTIMMTMRENWIMSQVYSLYLCKYQRTTS